MKEREIRAERLKGLPPYLFAELDRAKQRLAARGVDVIDFSVGDPDLPPPPFLIAELKKALADPAVYRYPPYQGTPEFCAAVSRYYRRKYDIRINPEKEVWSLIGSKEGLAHLVLALVNPGETVLVPDPVFPMYRSSITFAGGVPHFMPLTRENDYLPDLTSIKPSVARRAKLMLLNYPNNPTAAVATREFYREAIRFAGKYGIIICQDAAYADIYFGQRPVSFLEMPGAKEVGVETGSFTKMFNIAGWRVGWLAGNERMVQAVGHLKTHIDSGLFVAFQKACVAALNNGEASVARIRRIYQKRRDRLVAGLRQLGWPVKIPQATFYVWAELPPKYPEAGKFCLQVLENCGLALTPGTGFGANGAGYVRFSLTVPEPRLRKALQRLRTFL